MEGNSISSSPYFPYKADFRLVASILFMMQRPGDISNSPFTRNSVYLHLRREALCLGENKEAALENFRKKLVEAIKNSWSVSLNWYLHNVARTGN